MCRAIFHTGGEVTLIDDYGHHPSEVAATVEALRSGWPDRRLVMVFQPHRYSRTADLYEDFVEVLSAVDVLLLLDVYSAGESKIPGADSRSLTRSIRLRGKVEPLYVKKEKDVRHILSEILLPGDMVLTQEPGVWADYRGFWHPRVLWIGNLLIFIEETGLLG